MKKIEKSEYEWFGHAVHFICAAQCRFHLATKVGRFLVSTVGEYWPDMAVRRIHAQVYDPKWSEKVGALISGDEYDQAFLEHFGFIEIGCERKYETMVFELTSHYCDSETCGCGMPIVSSFVELDFSGYNKAGDATQGHRELCDKWAELQGMEEKKEEADEC